MAIRPLFMGTFFFHLYLFIQRSCSADGTWSGVQLECKAWNCEAPPEIADSTVHYTSTGLNSSAVYTCDTGLHFTPVAGTGNESKDALPSMVAVCSDERLWVTELGMPVEDYFCDKMRCLTAPRIDNAEVIGNIDKSVVSGGTDNSAGIGSVINSALVLIEPDQDRSVQSIGSATVTADDFDHYDVNATVRFECVDGYRRLGSDPELTCTDNGTWSFPFFECLKIDCGDPKPVANATVAVQDGTGMGSTAVYTCFPGFYHAGNQWSRTCGSDGMWSQEFIECASYGEEHCGEPPPVGNATIKTSSAKLTGTALYTCAEGYENFWTNTLYCSDYLASWLSSPDIQCRPVDCGDPPSIPHADVTYRDTTLGSEAIYRCDPGMHSPLGNTTICMSDGNWTTETLVECNLLSAASCGSPPDVANSLKEYASTTLGSVAKYTCDYGFTGQQIEASCSADGRWEFRESLGCSPVDCGEAPDIENSLSVHVSGTTFGHVAAYQCIEGYTHTGPSLKTCEASQLWSSDVVECLPAASVFCGDPPRRDYVTVSYTSRMEGAEAVYSCNEGYERFDASSFCENNGQWSEPQIDCWPISCNSPNLVPFSNLVTSSVNPDHFHYGELVSFVCIRSFVPKPRYPLSSTCLEDGTWSEVDGRCEIATVDIQNSCVQSPPDVLNARMTSHTGNFIGSFVSYTCEPGYKPFPPKESFFHTCMPKGVWSSEFLQCVPTRCVYDTPPVVANADFLGIENVDYEDRVVRGVYNCTPGHTTDGQLPRSD